MGSNEVRRYHPTTITRIGSAVQRVHTLRVDRARDVGVSYRKVKVAKRELDSEEM